MTSKPCCLVGRFDDNGHLTLFARLTSTWRFPLKRLSLIPLAAIAAIAQTKPAPVAPVPAPVAPATASAPIAPATSYASAGGTSAKAPLAPIVAELLQAHPGAPLTIDYVLLSPHSSAGQKAVTFEWANKDQVQAYVLWNNIFAAAEYSGATAPSGLTEASAGYMTSAWGAGAKIVYSDSTYDFPNSTKSATYYALNSVGIFGSMGLNGMDLFGSLKWMKPTTNNWYDYSSVAPTQDPYTLPRTDVISLAVGARQYPADGVEGLAWSGTGEFGYHYYRTIRGGGDSIPAAAFSAELRGQVGYVFLVDGINFLPGLDGGIKHYDAKSPDQLDSLWASPYASISVPVFENWTLLGGARYSITKTFNDYRKGEKSLYADATVLSGTSGSVGLRYTRNRWAVDAAVQNSFLTTGPYIISGQAPNGGFLARLGFSVNLK